MPEPDDPTYGHLYVSVDADAGTDPAADIHTGDDAGVYVAAADAAAGPPPPRPLTRAAKLRAAVLIALAAVVLLALLPAAIGLVWAPGNCIGCHATAAGNRTGPAAVHAQLDCRACHAGTTGSAGIVFREKQWYQMMLRLVPATDSAHAGVTSVRCRTCHATTLDAGTVTANGIHYDHAQCDSDRDCIGCHGASAHAPAPDAYVRSYTMDLCLDCHLQKRYFEVGDCSVCHADDETVRAEQSDGTRSASTFSATHGPNWKTAHGMGDQAICRACHATDFCEPCHGPGVPHSEYFLSSHGAVATASDNKCTTCHTQTDYCDSCHGTPMPHSKQFKLDHAATVNADGETMCLNCHVRDDCTACHTGHTHPGGTDLR
jgi:predicted CXXCH cytochrome family protein